MNIIPNRLGNALGALALGSMLISPLSGSAQEADIEKSATVEKGGKAAKKNAQRLDRQRRAMLKAAELHRAGKHEEARKLEKKILSAAVKESKKATAAEVKAHSKVEAVERRAAEPHKTRKNVVEPPPGVKLQHLRQAAEHLQAAGYEPQADQAVAEIKRLEAEVKGRAVRPGLARPMDPVASLRGEVMKLRRDLEGLRREVMRLKSPVGRRSPGRSFEGGRSRIGEGVPPVVPQDPEKPPR